MSTAEGPLHADLTFVLGDSWAAPEAWAVLLNDLAVDLASGGWVVTAHARAEPADPTVLVEWSTGNGRILLEDASVTLSTGAVVTTSTVRLRHSAAASATWAPFAGGFDCQIQRGPVDDPERYTIASGTVRARRDTTRP